MITEKNHSMSKLTDLGFAEYQDCSHSSATVPTVLQRTAVLCPTISCITTTQLLHLSTASTSFNICYKFSFHAPYGWLLPSIINFPGFSGNPSYHLQAVQLSI